MTPSSAHAGEHPMIPGVVHGVRGWRVDEHSLLRGTGYGYQMPWSPDGEATSAHCLSESHRAPDPECSCGLYALHPSVLGSRPSHMAEGVAYFGVVEAWGRMELHAMGFRAQYARPLVIFEPAFHLVGLEELATVASVSKRYDAEIASAPRFELAGEWCRKEGLGLSPETVAELVGIEAGWMTA